MSQLFHDIATGLGRVMAGGGDKSRRQKNDFYPTPSEVTQALMDREIYRIRKISPIIWEPCAGDGAITRVLEQYGLRSIANDIAPQASGIEHLNFLTTNRAASPVLLKSTFWHAEVRSSLWQRYRPSMIYQLNWRPDFLGKGAPTMECSWIVWDQQRANNRHCHTDILLKPSLTQKETLL